LLPDPAKGDDSWDPIKFVPLNEDGNVFVTVLTMRVTRAVVDEVKTEYFDHQLLGGPPGRRGGEEDRPEEAGHGCALDGDVSCNARYPCNG